ncbi:MAG TPA: tRNA (adenosine(37)-N6)-threonylcarbamoyltransferase complex ATPase subunit type 1 TsaE [Bacteroidales bacterium]|jgi:tRNA threonylcarbamoyladenosine biosynthesis protein TsaE|nr:tRNA (adenosine(37)-N6)-threonylcarbamoyltransferase complex ATPase subunit type 1 TsaE [Bacteroidales bacterium]MDD4235747.1 tRNA (adenosine(37)-N6)-threonylcarbamoyltransferase complex ATPase subunit type 1 TsaE [Bacteroidales bacterium]MDY0161376.1 tRNA (adenosine(37)-N6)-threonylcarbamoyltransferase complex ATPase subunit type 1 TsaE [Bacteroidales bacterium]HXK81785.1 tRNA (adenosine(37)-N6)-threonylcarbamoyltransferase complex ATPase subunit type 1 TsaE [Bacteroidales bacterium]
MPKVIVNNIKELDKFTKSFENILKLYRLVAFKGQLGAGKTTLIKALCEKLKVEDIVSSPSFAIVNEYFSEIIGTIFHFDFYRIENENEILDIGFEDYLTQNALILMEWPEKIPNLLPPDTLIVNINVLTDNSRLVEW